MAELDRLADDAAGDSEALRQLLTTIQGDVWRFCAHLTNPADADDLTQETLTRLIAGLRRWDGDTVMPWVLGIARNVCFEHLRRRHQRRTDPYAQPQVPPSADRTGVVDIIQLLAACPTTAAKPSC